MPGAHIKKHLCVSVTLLQPMFHGRRGDGDPPEPEWPPSPLRLYQAVVAAAAARWLERERLVAPAPALRWLESLPPPRIVAPSATPTDGYVLSVPNNAMDKVAAAWSRGNYSNAGDANPSTHRAMKRIRPVRLHGPDHTLHYLWPLPDPLPPEAAGHIRTLTLAARCIVALGWGIDAAIGDALVIDAAQADSLRGERWHPESPGGAGWRLPRPGTLDDLCRRHAAFLNRVTADGFVPVPPLRAFETAQYRRASDPQSRPYSAFVLRPLDGDAAYAPFRPERAVCVAAMVRHATCKAALGDLDAAGWRTKDWSLRFVAGHGPAGSPKRRAKDDAAPRFSYLPLPTTGPQRPDGLIRRVLIAEPFGGDGRSARWAAQRLHGSELIDEDRGRVARLEAVDPAEPDFAKVFRLYARRGPGEAADTWASVTPVILPGFDDNKPAKREKLLLDCLDHAGIDRAAVASLESRPPSWHAGIAAPSSAFKRPHYLKHLPAMHVRIVFRAPVMGPISLGAGRHCGLGVLAVLSRG